MRPNLQNNYVKNIPGSDTFQDICWKQDSAQNDMELD